MEPASPRAVPISIGLGLRLISIHYSSGLLRIVKHQRQQRLLLVRPFPLWVTLVVSDYVVLLEES